jgi:hypothetical protein
MMHGWEHCTDSVATCCLHGTALHLTVSVQVNLNWHPYPFVETYHASTMVQQFGIVLRDHVQDDEGGSSSGPGAPFLHQPPPPQPSMLQPGNSSAVMSMDVFSHLTGLEHLRELQVCPLF